MRPLPLRCSHPAVRRAWRHCGMEQAGERAAEAGTQRHAPLAARSKVGSTQQRLRSIGMARLPR
uniref:Uncharacterized protein n=1 Tax=Arundo donax TaxID=35708 RepID=A0A0A9G8D0_ARUDO